MARANSKPLTKPSINFEVFGFDQGGKDVNISLAAIQRLFEISTNGISNRYTLTNEILDNGDFIVDNLDPALTTQLSFYYKDDNEIDLTDFFDMLNTAKSNLLLSIREVGSEQLAVFSISGYSIVDNIGTFTVSLKDSIKRGLFQLAEAYTLDVEYATSETVLDSKLSVDTPDQGLTEDQQKNSLINLGIERAKTASNVHGFYRLGSSFNLVTGFDADPIYTDCKLELPYNYDLGTGTTTIPAGVTLEFNGGKIVNGTIAGNNTKLNPGLSQVFDTTTNFSGTFDYDYVTPQMFGAKADGTTDDTAAIQKAIDSFEKVKLIGTYAITEDISIGNNTILSDKAVIKVQDGLVDDIGGVLSNAFKIVKTTGASTIKGDLVLDGNRNNVTGLYIGFYADSADVVIENIRAINCSYKGITTSENATNLNAKLLIAENCALGLELFSPYCSVETMICKDLNSNVSSVFQHCIDIFGATNSYFGSIQIINSDGDTTGSSAWLSGLTMRNFNNNKVGTVILDSMTSTTLNPVAFSLLSSYNSEFDSLQIRGWDGGRQVEILGARGCIFNNINVEGIHGFQRGVLTELGVGITLSNSAVENFPERHNTAASDNIFNNVYISNMSESGIIDGGYGNIFNNVKVYGCEVDGIVITRKEDNSPNFGFVEREIGGSTWNNVISKGNGRNGMSIFWGTDIKINGCTFTGNGTDTTADYRSGLYISEQLDNDEVLVVGCTTDDDYQERNVSEGISTTTIDLSQGDFEATFPRGTHNLYPGALVNMRNATAVAGDAFVRVQKVTSIDEAIVTPITPTDESTSYVASNLSGTITSDGTSTITGVGTSFTTELLGRYWINASGQNFKVVKVNSDTEIIVDRDISGISGATAQRRRFFIEGVQRQLYGVKFGANAHHRVMSHRSRNNATGAFDGATGGNSQGGFVTVAATSNLTVTFDIPFDSIPSVTAVSRTTNPADAQVSIFNITTTGFDVYNGASGIRNINWIAIN